MNKEDLKEILTAQVKPIEEAVRQKLEYLQSDMVFEIIPADNQTSEDVNTDEISDTSLADAFAQLSDTSAHEYAIPQQASSDTKYKSPLINEKTLEERKRDIAEKIAALRGLSLPGSYLRKKKF